MITAAVLGASGYSGAELLRLLSQRDDVKLTHLVAAASAGKAVHDIYPAFAGVVNEKFEPYEPEKISGTDVVFLALPSGEAMTIVPQLKPHVGHIIDLGGDFRLHSADLYQEFYQHNHSAPQFLAESVYGLPEANEKLISSARLIANPGCYPTSAVLALLPALKMNLISPSGIIINSLSGVSGAGRSSSVDLSFSEVNENIRAYKIGKHQHIPEIQSALELFGGKQVSFSFVPHLVPITRGIYTTIHANLSTSLSRADMMSVYQEFYSDAPFVRIKSEIPQIASVVRTNYCDIYVTAERRTNQLVIVSVIDNLVKGAAGQAIQNMNIMLHLPQQRGLL